jgi:hypothetical protein
LVIVDIINFLVALFHFINLGSHALRFSPGLLEFIFERLDTY